MRHRYFAFFLILGLLVLATASAFAEQGKRNDCTLAGTWYGGSVVAYSMTITQSGPAGHYVTYAEGMYKTSVLSTGYAGTLDKKGNRFEGSGMALATSRPEYLNPPPFEAMPDLLAAWFSMELVDCNTIKNTIPFFGSYTGSEFWKPGSPWTGVNWISGGKAPLVDAPDLDMIPLLTGDTKPIVETYHRLPQKVNAALLHKN